MKQFAYGLMSVSALLVAVSTTTVQGSERDDTSAEETVRRLFDAFNRHDIDALAALYADDAEIMSPEHPQPLHGAAGVRAIYSPLFARFPDIQDRIVGMTRQDGRVAVEFMSTGCAASGKGCFELPIASFLTVRDGRIVRDASYFDVPAGQ